MHDFGSINWLAVLVAALAGFVIGGLWYGPLFQKPWKRLSGWTPELAGRANTPLIFGGAFVLNFVIATGIAILNGPHTGWLLGMHTGLFTAVFFVATALGVIYLFEQKPLQLWLINAGYQIVLFAVIGAIIGAWPA